MVARENSWSEIQRAWSALTEKAKGDAFEDLTQAYLKIAPEYASKLKHVWRLEEVPEAVRRKLRLPGTDKGIDLVAETHGGEYWAVQCKYRTDTDRQLTHTDISTFTSLTFQACKGFSFALVCSTTERVTQLYRGEERIGFLALDTWQGLDREFFEALRARQGAKKAKLEPRQPRPHQIAAVKDGLEHFRKGKASRGKLIMPCGTGKSLTAWFLTKSLGSKKVLIAVPSLSLVRQTLKVWLRETTAHGLDVDWICVCSDESAGRADQDDVVVHRQDLAVPCLTSTDKIADWLKAKRKGLTVVFTTYQSGDVLATAARKAKFGFDLGIMDEAHKTVGDSDKQFSHLLHDHNIEIGQRVFMTATERRYKGSSDKVLSMDDPEIYGETFHQLSFKQAMECQPPILCDYNVITIGVTKEEIRDLIRRNAFVRPTKGKWDEEMEADMLAALVALRKAMKQYPIRHAVSFHSSIQRAELFRQHNDTFSQEFPEFGNLATFHVSGQTPTGTRSRIIQEFADAKRSLVTNARCLTEGVDVPGIDCVLFADPRRSTVDIVQAVGRALRPSDGKKLGYVILPVLHDSETNSEDTLESGQFKEIVSTISALAANDDRIIEYFREISQGRRPVGGARVIFDLGEKVAENLDVAKLVQELEVKCWGRLARFSWMPFEEARHFSRSLGLSSEQKWREWSKGTDQSKPKRPENIPIVPPQVYRSEWKGWGDWLGTGNTAPRDRTFWPYKKARAWVQSLRIPSAKAWSLYASGKSDHKKKRPKEIPHSPSRAYANAGWVNWSDWLGTTNVSNHKKRFLTFPAARKLARTLNLKSETAWRAMCAGRLDVKRPSELPSNPNTQYAGQGWVGWGDFLGSGAISNREKSRKWRNFAAARQHARSLGLSGETQWRLYCKGLIPNFAPKPTDIPSNPDSTYRYKGWIGYADWLGTNNTTPKQRI
jgi:predicted helicase